jgi:hypothetical protein
MEILMCASDGLTPPPDTFVSMRVGQEMKHAKFAQYHTYRFDQADPSGKVPVKLEVFQRIGQTAVTFGGVTGDIQDVAVPINGGEALRMRVSSSNALPDTPTAAAKKKHKVVNDARSYLARHKLHELLKDAMQEVVNVKPGNPHEFLAGYILSRADPMPISSRVIPGKRYAEAYGDADVPTDSKAQPRTLPPIEGEKPSLPDLPHCPMASMFLGAKASMPFADSAKQLKPLMPEDFTTEMDKAAKRLAGLSQEQSLPESCEKVPEFKAFQLRPSVGTWCAPKPTPLPKPEEAPSYRSFQLRPSVGTWCVAQLNPSLEDWVPTHEELMAINVLIKFRQLEVNNLTEKLRVVTATMEVKRSPRHQQNTEELAKTAEEVKTRLQKAKSELNALQQWDPQHRGFRQWDPLRRGYTIASMPDV